MTKVTRKQLASELKKTLKKLTKLSNSDDMALQAEKNVIEAIGWLLEKN